ncbi:MAG: diacylglycerol kinase family lipid kinase [Lachnospiraceae bacterium]|jgi:diacylglycerol kinase (ATP)|nr:diacylglycerol kinase family lipid kinase [Lachnospiraceae bacterium]
MDQSEKKLFLIYNPHAGKEHIKGRLYEIVQVLADAGYELTVYPTKGYQDATERIVNLPDGYDMVVCSGGDGTLDEVVTGMMRRENKIPIGYIPAGTCNDFARSLKIPNQMGKAAEIAAYGENFSFDVGSFNENNFIYIAAFGIFTDVSYSTKQEVKNTLGQMAYVLEGMKRLYNVKSYYLRVTSEEMTFEGDFLFGMVTNSKSVGGFKSIIGKNVIFDDGVYEITFIRRPSNPMELQEILAALLIKEIDTKYMYSFRSSRIVVESVEPVPWTLDGEFGGEHKRVVISNNPRAVEIRVTKQEEQSIVVL